MAGRWSEEDQKEEERTTTTKIFLIVSKKNCLDEYNKLSYYQKGKSSCTRYGRNRYLSLSQTRSIKAAITEEINNALRSEDNFSKSERTETTQNDSSNVTDQICKRRRFNPRSKE